MTNNFETLAKLTPLGANRVVNVCFKVWIVTPPLFSNNIRIIHSRTINGFFDGLINISSGFALFTFKNISGFFTAVLAMAMDDCF